jgi:hypothetical protein
MARTCRLGGQLEPDDLSCGSWGAAPRAGQQVDELHSATCFVVARARGWIRRRQSGICVPDLAVQRAVPDGEAHGRFSPRVPQRVGDQFADK